MTIKELQSCLIYDTLDKKWICPRKGTFSQYSIFQNRLKVNDHLDKCFDVKQILSAFSSLPDLPTSYCPRGIFHNMVRVFYDGYDKRFTTYIFSDLRDFDDDWLNR